MWPATPVTRKQAWRRYRRSRRSMSTSYDDIILRTSSQKEKDNEEGFERSRRTHSAPGSLERSRGGGSSKHVSFERVVRVTLIPSRKDFDISTQRSVWYSGEDMMAFKRNAYEVFKVYGHVGFVEDEFTESGLFTPVPEYVDASSAAHQSPETPHCSLPPPTPVNEQPMSARALSCSLELAAGGERMPLVGVA